MRLDIQGLRALAVALVVVFHLSPATVPGGYIGVDVFFVISGFLITSHLLREVDRIGTVRLGEFWARRVRRLLPAALLVLAMSALAGWIILPRSVLSQNLVEIAFAAGYVLNWRLASDSVDYLAAANAPSLAQHYWSLSVEEQFYIVWPLLIIAAVFIAARTGRANPRIAATIALTLVCAASLAFSIYETAHSQPSAYFVTTTRAWEFALGGLVGMAPALAARTRWLHPLLSWAALGAVCGSAMLFSATTAFPGWIALVPVLGTGVLLWVGDSTSTWSPQYLARSGPIQFVGDTSYAIYLWHWPLIILVTAHLGRAPGWKWQGLLAVSTVALAGATKYLVEDPVRNATGLLKRPVPTYAFMAVGMALVLGISLTSLKMLQVPTSPEVTKVAESLLDGSSANDQAKYGAEVLRAFPRNDPAGRPIDAFDLIVPSPEGVTTSGCSAKIADAALTTCSYGDLNGDLHIALVGDSHAAQWAQALDIIGKQRGWKIHEYTKQGCPITTGVVMWSAEPYENCVTWNNKLLDQLSSGTRYDLMLTSTLDAPMEDGSPLSDHMAERWSEIMELTDSPLAVIANTPFMSMNVPDCVSANPTNLSECVTPRTQADRSDGELAQAAAQLDLPVINLVDAICPTDECPAVIGSVIIYSDTHHLTAHYVGSLAPRLAGELNKVSGPSPERD